MTDQATSRAHSEGLEAEASDEVSNQPIRIGASRQHASDTPVSYLGRCSAARGSVWETPANTGTDTDADFDEWTGT